MKIYIVILCSVLFSSGLIGQDERAERGEKIKALQIAFITEELDLSAEISEKFWPVYNAHQKEERMIKEKFYPQKKMEEMSDDEAMTFIENRLNMEEQLLNLNKQYVADLKNILEPKQIARLFMLEREFKRKMLRTIRDNRKDQKNSSKGMK